MSDETNQTSEAASDGAADPNEVMTRAGARKIIDQRDQLKSNFDSLQADFTSLELKHADLRARTKAKPDGKATPKAEPKPADVPDVLGEFMAQVKAELADVKDMFSQHRAGTAKSAVLSAVLKEVPDGQHKTAEALLGTLGVDFTLPGAAADALAILRTDHAAVLVDHSRGAQPRAPQLMPDGKPDFKVYKTFDEVPSEWMSAAIADPATFERLSASTEVGSTEHCI